MPEGRIGFIRLGRTQGIVGEAAFEGGDALFQQYRPGSCSEDKRCSGQAFAGEEQKDPSACWIRMLPPRRKAPGAGDSSCSSLKRPCRTEFRCRFTGRNHPLLEMLDRATRNEITCERRIKLSQEQIRLPERLAPSSTNVTSPRHTGDLDDET